MEKYIEFLSSGLVEYSFNPNYISGIWMFNWNSLD
jgi:hypothetical protein